MTCQLVPGMSCSANDSFSDIIKSYPNTVWFDKFISIMCKFTCFNRKKDKEGIRV